MLRLNVSFIANDEKKEKQLFQLEGQTPSYFHNPKKTHPYADPLSSQNNNICQTNLTYSTLSNSKKRHNYKNDGTTTRNVISQQQNKKTNQSQMSFIKINRSCKLGRQFWMEVGVYKKLLHSITMVKRK